MKLFTCEARKLLGMRFFLFAVGVLLVGALVSCNNIVDPLGSVDLPTSEKDQISDDGQTPVFGYYYLANAAHCDDRYYYSTQGYELLAYDFSTGEASSPCKDPMCSHQTVLKDLDTGCPFGAGAKIVSIENKVIYYQTTYVDPDSEKYSVFRVYSYNQKNLRQTLLFELPDAFSDGLICKTGDYIYYERSTINEDFSIDIFLCRYNVKSQKNETLYAFDYVVGSLDANVLSDRTARKRTNGLEPLFVDDQERVYFTSTANMNSGGDFPLQLYTSDLKSDREAKKLPGLEKWRVAASNAVFYRENVLYFAAKKGEASIIAAYDLSTARSTVLAENVYPSFTVAGDHLYCFSRESREVKASGTKMSVSNTVLDIDLTNGQTQSATFDIGIAGWKAILNPVFAADGRVVTKCPVVSDDNGELIYRRSCLMILDLKNRKCLLSDAL